MHSNVPVILDACVLVQAAVRDTLLRLSERRLFLVRWSDRILEEVASTLLKFGLAQAKVDYLRGELNKHFPDALVEGYEELISSMKNEEKDRHVAAAAVKAGCEVIVTYNLKHFKQEHLKHLDIRARHPDEFLIDLYYLSPDAVVHTLHQQGSELKQPRTLPQVLDILRAMRCKKFADLITEKLVL